MKKKTTNKNGKRQIECPQRMDIMKGKKEEFKNMIGEKKQTKVLGKNIIHGKYVILFFLLHLYCFNFWESVHLIIG